MSCCENSAGTPRVSGVSPIGTRSVAVEELAVTPGDRAQWALRWGYGVVAARLAAEAEPVRVGLDTTDLLSRETGKGKTPVQSRRQGNQVPSS